MSSSDSEELSVERYDIEDNLNVYGSPIYETTEAAEQSKTNVVLPARTEVSE
jgi:hypothetical protein